MSPLPLDRFSEPYSPNGNMAGQGASRTLRTTALDRLTLLIREAVQNSSDAGKSNGGSPIQFGVDYWRPQGGQLDLLRSVTFRHAATSPLGEGADMAAILNQDRVGLLAISDRRTSGLGGPTRADIAPHPGEHTDFVDFLRNIGAPQDTSMGGGTYGYGKAALFNVSRLGTLCVYTRCNFRGARQSRLLCAALGHSYIEGGRNYTGRHWWGRMEDEFLEPILDAEADDLAAGLGIPPMEGTGTTIVIVAPFFDTFRENGSAACNRIVDAILNWCWPRIVTTDQASRIEFSVSWEGQPVTVPDPANEERLRPFVRSLRAAEQAENDDLASTGSLTHVFPIESQRPRERLGLLALTRSAPLAAALASSKPDADDHDGQPDEDEAALGQAWSLRDRPRLGLVARMRRVRLVVDYMEIGRADSAGMDCAGVFLTRNDSRVDGAFSASEPPSHDAWLASLVQDPHQRRFVNVAARRVREVAEDFAAPQTGQLATPPDSPRPSLGVVGSRLGSLLPAVEGPAPGGWVPAAGTDRSGTSRATGQRFRRIAIRYGEARLQELQGQRVLAVPLTVRVPEEGPSVLLSARPHVVLDGADAGTSEAEPPEGAGRPAVVGWLDGGGQPAALPLAPAGESQWTALVSVPADTVVRVTVEVESSDG